VLHRAIVPGDHLKVWRGPYWHHAIYIGNGYVIHYWGGKNDKRSSCVQVSTLAEFIGESGMEAVAIVEYAQCSPADTVVARAWHQRGATGWHAVSNNCESFARWAKTGVLRSLQAEAVVGVGGGAAGSGVATAAAVGIVSSAGAVAGLSGPGVLSGLSLVGSAVGGGAVAGVAVLSAAPAVAATIAAHHAFRDDASLPAPERSARTVARRASAVGAAAGTLGSIAAISAAGAVPGLSGAGIASGLVGIGGTMVGGVVVAIAAPAIAAGVLGYAAYRLFKR
jgi:Lecithin retinol acyltransferase